MWCFAEIVLDEFDFVVVEIGEFKNRIPIKKIYWEDLNQVRVDHKDFKSGHFFQKVGRQDYDSVECQVQPYYEVSCAERINQLINYVVLKVELYKSNLHIIKVFVDQNLETRVPHEDAVNDMKS